MDIDRPPEVVVVAGGSRPERAVTGRLERCRVIAADAGVDVARSMGLDVDVAVGDFDSLPPETVTALDGTVGDVRRFPDDKDATDLELALDVAGEHGPARVLVVGLEGGRPDHALANLLVAASDRYAHLDVTLVLDRGRAWVVRDELTGRLDAGALLSVLPVHGDATVSVSGVRWPLARFRLTAGTTRGVSNEALGGAVTVTAHAGTAICIAPRPPSPTEPSPSNPSPRNPEDPR